MKGQGQTMSNFTNSSTAKVMDGYHGNQDHGNQEDGNDDILLSDQMYQENKQSMVSYKSTLLVILSSLSWVTKIKVQFLFGFSLQ